MKELVIVDEEVLDQLVPQALSLPDLARQRDEQEPEAARSRERQDLIKSYCCGYTWDGYRWEGRLGSMARINIPNQAGAT